MVGSLVAGLAAVGVVGWILWMLKPPVTRLDVPATRVWTNTGVRCETGDRLEIAMSGEAQWRPGATSGPEGHDDPDLWPFRAGPGLETANHLAVIGSLDQMPPFFVVGTEETYTCERAGVLWLGVNDVGPADNSGAFEAEVTLRRGR